MTTDEEIRESIKKWITQKCKNGHDVTRAFRDILGNAKNNVSAIAEQINEKRAAMKGVDEEEIERALEPFYIVAHREERILVNSKAVQKSGWKPEKT